MQAKIYFMATGVPEMLDAGKVDLMLACLKARTADAAREALLKLGIVQDDHRISYTAIKDTWGSICAVTHRGSVVECTCWHHRRRGHCPHMWAVTALTGMRHFEKEVLPEFPRADMQSGSSQEGRPAKKRKKSRKLYKPKPALPASADAVPEPPPKRSQRVLKPQRAKRSVFNR